MTHGAMGQLHRRLWTNDTRGNGPTTIGAMYQRQTGQRINNTPSNVAINEGNNELTTNGAMDQLQTGPWWTNDKRDNGPTIHSAICQ